MWYKARDKALYGNVGDVCVNVYEKEREKERERERERESESE